MFKNIIVIVLLISVCTAFPTLRYIKLFGNILASHSVRNLGLRVTAPAGGNRIILKYPQSQLQERFTIQGIKTVQNIPDSKMEIIDGGIGKDKITIAMTLPPNRDVNTEFYFYGDAEKPQNSPNEGIPQKEHKRTRRNANQSEQPEEDETKTKSTVFETIRKFLEALLG